VGPGGHPPRATSKRRQLLEQARTSEDIRQLALERAQAERGRDR
jgi:hypothetical protein